MAKKIKITEEQLKKVVNVINEQQFDDVYTKYQKEKGKELSMSSDDGRLLYNLAQNWCEGKPDHPDCKEVEDIGTRLKLH